MFPDTSSTVAGASLTNSDENRTTAAPATDPTGALCFYEIALDGTVTSLNPAGRLQLGLDPESDSINFRYLDVINAQDQLRVEGLLQAAFHGDSSAFEFLSNGVVSQTLTARFIRIKDFDGAVTKGVGVTHGGAEAHGRVTSRRADRERLTEFAADGTFSGYRGSALDVAERRTAEHALEVGQVRFSDFAEIAAEQTGSIQKKQMRWVFLLAWGSPLTHPNCLGSWLAWREINEGWRTPQVRKALRFFFAYVYAATYSLAGD